MSQKFLQYFYIMFFPYHLMYFVKCTSAPKHPHMMHPPPYYTVELVFSGFQGSPFYLLHVTISATVPFVRHQTCRQDKWVCCPGPRIGEVDLVCSVKARSEQTKAMQEGRA
ncbi:hypothetical protein XENORESO_001660 [Xenotaenia resolanae]|uniref:Secreted protein n=1 Tax=Xenotaenia resolanae TaxID=208358 RepID=A0ABV0WUG9_9TELE